jgi:hypothetical protein
MASSSLIFHDIRDLYAGTNLAGQNIARAIALAKQHHHPDLQWMEMALNTEPPEHPVAYAYWLLAKKSWEWNQYSLSKLTQTALVEKNEFVAYVYGMISRGRCFSRTDEECLKQKCGDVILNMSKTSNDRDLLFLDFCLNGTLTSLQRAWNFRKIVAGQILAHTESVTRKKVEILIDLATAGEFQSLVDYMRNHRAVLVKAETAYILGKHYLINGEKRVPLELLNSVRDAVLFYKKQVLACQAAVHAFTLCATRMNICKDMRIYIAKFIWNTRTEALF